MAKYNTNSKNSSKKIDFKKILTWSALGSLLIVLFVVLQKVMKNVNGFFGTNDSNEGSGVLGSVTGNSSGSNTGISTTGGGLATTYTTTGIKTSTKLLVDLIHEKLAGSNFYLYPEVVNRLANLSLSELKLACQYFGNKYNAIVGKNFYQFINSEWHAGNYNSALKALKKTGYYGS